MLKVLKTNMALQLYSYPLEDLLEDIIKILSSTTTEESFKNTNLI